MSGWARRGAARVVLAVVVGSGWAVPAAAGQPAAPPVIDEGDRPAEVPLIESPALAPPRADLPDGIAAGLVPEDPDERATDAEPPDPSTEVVEERAARARVYESPDGTRQVVLSAEPVNYETSPGVWKPIDARVVPDRAQRGVLRSAANSWTARFAPIGQGQAAGGPSISTAAGRVDMVPRDAAAAAPEQVEGRASTVRYAGVWPDTDLDYTVQSTGVKEDIVVHAPAAPSRFAFGLRGATATRGDHGTLRLNGPTGTFTVPAASVLDADGNDVTAASGAAYELLDGGAAIAVAVDPEWLAGLDQAAFPVRIDPQVVVQPSLGMVSRSSDGQQVGGTDIRFGKSGSVSWRAQLDFDYETYMDDPADYRVTGAYLQLLRVNEDIGDPAVNTASLYVPTADTFAGTKGEEFLRFGYDNPPSDPTNVFSWGDGQVGDVQALLQRWFDQDLRNKRLGIVGAEPAGSGAATLHRYRATLTLTFDAPPPATSLSAPAEGAVLATRTPKLTAVALGGSEPVRYRFEVGTDASSALMSSGWTTATEWTVPDGVLRDGASYTATVATATPAMVAADSEPRNPTSVRHFRVDMGLGQGGVAPTETAGAVPGVTSSPSEGAPSPGTPGASFTVNMIDGNLAASVPTHSLSTPSGSIGPALVYNSRADSLAGLVGRYYSDDGDHVLEDGTDRRRGQRVDPAVNFSWLGTAGMVGSMPAGPVLVRWTGFLRVPSSGQWEIGVATDGIDAGSRVFLNGESTPAADDWAAQPNWRPPILGAPRALNPQTLVPIRVDFWSDWAGGGVKLLARGTDGVLVEVPQSWLSQSAPVLPQGWQLSAGAADVGYVGLEDHGGVVLVRRVDGSTEGYLRMAAGGYAPPLGGENHLALDAEGRFVLATPGLLYRFDEDGQLEHVTSAADDRQPAALDYDYGGSPLRLQAITDPISDRQVAFTYAGGGCSGPAGMLCRITFSDGATTDLSYDTSGRLTRVTNPGVAGCSGTLATLFDFGYDTTGRLTSVRDPLAADAVACGTRTDGPDLRTRFTYDTSAPSPLDRNRLKTITPPLPAPGAASGTTTYTYNADRTTTVSVSGFSPTTGFARRVRYDDKGHIVENTDAAGLITSYVWDDRNQVVAVTAPGSLRSTHAYDASGNRTDTWGPAPASQFGTDHRPLPGTDVPHATVAYDEGFQGLAATYWSNPDLAGPPAKHASGIDLDDTWSGGPPVTPDGQGDWSLRLTGEMQMPLRDTHFEGVLGGTGSTRVWIDDQLVLDTDDFWNGGVFSGDAAGEWHRIRVDFVFDEPGDVLNVRVGAAAPPGYRQVQLAELKPAYGLPTGAVDADGKVATTEYSDPARHIGPELGLATATVQDPVGLNLRTATTYEDPTQGGFLRRTSKALPSGGTTTTAYYESGDPVPAACGVTSSVPQVGFAKRVTHPDPDGSGSEQPLVEEVVHDATGRVVGTRMATSSGISSAPWSCVIYDGRGRVTTETWPARGSNPARWVLHEYAFGGDPLSTRVREPALPAAGTITTTMDMLGRLVDYEAPGSSTLRVYDDLGRPSVVFDNGLWTLSTYDTGNGRLSSVMTTDGGFMGQPPAAQHTITATPAYDTTTGRISGVSYSNGTTAGYVYDSAGRPSWTVYHGPGGTPLAGEIVERSPAGRVLEQLTMSATGAFVDTNPSGDNFVYDGAGRLAASWGTAGGELYGYGTASCGEANAGLNTNLTSVVRGGVVESYCYDRADRLTSGTGVASTSYDDHGNTTTLGTQTYLWDASDRHVGIRTGSSSGTVDYLRDPLNRILERQGAGSTTRYVYGGFGDAPSALANGSGTIIERYAGLPGGVSVTMAAGSTTETWSYTNQHGDVIATADRAGVRQGTPVTYGPWGAGSSTPDTHHGSRDAGYLGGGGNRFVDHPTTAEPVIDMGARPYIPRLGRFLATDPVEGGCANAYVYAFGDPVNATDVSGRAGEGQGTNTGPCEGYFYVTARSDSFSFGFHSSPRVHGIGFLYDISRPGEQVTGFGQDVELFGTNGWEKTIDYGDVGYSNGIEFGGGGGGSVPVTTVTVTFFMLDSWNAIRYQRDQDYEYCVATATDTYNW